VSQGGSRPGGSIPDSVPVEFDILASPAAGAAAIRGGALRVSGYLFGVALTVASAAVLFRYLGPAKAGQYVTAFAVVGIVGNMLDGGLSWLAVREAAVRRGADRRAVIADLLGMRLLLSVAAIVLATAFAVAVGYDSALVIGIGLASVGAALLSVQLILAAPLIADLRLGWVTAIDVFRSAFVVVLILAFVWGGLGLLAFLAVPIPVGLACVLWAILLVRNEITLAASFRMDAWRVLLRDVVPYALATAAGLLYFRVAVVLLSLISSKHETGLYSAAFRIVEVLMLVPQLAVGAVLPILARAAREDHDRLAYGIDRAFRAAAVLGTGLAVVLVIGAPFAIAVVAGPDFSGAADMLRIQALGLGVALVTSVFTYALLSLRMYRELLVANTTALGVSIALTLTLGRVWGGMGAATATVVAELCLAGGAGWLLLRRHPALRPEWLFLLRVAAAGLATAALVLIPGVPSVVLAAAGAVVYTVLAFVLRLVPEEVLAELGRVRQLRNARS
jgi:O-antigen/teichoic acid export membrane protein